MEAGKTIALTGKGGTGKSIVASLMIHMLARRHPGQVLAIDADSAMSLQYTLGIPVEKTVSAFRKEIVGLQQIKREMNDKPLGEVMRGLINHGEGIDLLAMGRPEEPGCYCTVNDLLRYGMDQLTQGYMITIVDGEAGPEQINRRVLGSIDTLLVVADMSVRSLETARGILSIAKKSADGIHVKQTGLILNRVRGDASVTELSERVGVPVIGCIPEDAVLNQYDRDGKPLRLLPPDTPSVAAVQDILRQLQIE